jgi:hypothetical protein
VIAQLEGYFQLLDLADWDYAINLSAEDFPLMSTAAMHKKLEVCPNYYESYRKILEKAISSIGSNIMRLLSAYQICLSL